jgi:hypothetical protein
MNLEQLGLLGVFIAGAIPWFEAIGVVPVGIVTGLDPVWVVVWAVAGNTLTIFAFAYAGSQIRSWLSRRSKKPTDVKSSKRWERGQRAFDKYGIIGMAALGPILIGTQFAAAISVAAGVKPLKTSLYISVATLLWSVLIAVLSVWGGLDTLLEQ